MVENLPVEHNSMDEQSQLNPSSIDNVNIISETRHHVSDYINHHLTRDGFEWTTCPSLSPSRAFNLTMRVLGDEFELRYKDVFNEMSTQLHITPSSAYPTFMGVTDELFRDGIQWGRIVALFAFGGSIASQAMNKEMPLLVDSIVEWVTTYVDDHLMGWINENGSWNGLVEYYDMDISPAEIQDSNWPTLKNFFCGVAAGAIGVLTIGALMTTRS